MKICIENLYSYFQGLIPQDFAVVFLLFIIAFDDMMPPYFEPFYLTLGFL